MNALLTVEDAAKLLSVKPKTLRALASDHKIPAFKVGKSWRFKEDELEQWARERSRENVLCPSIDVKIQAASGMSGSKSLGAKLDALLKQQIEPPPKTTKRNFAVLSGGKSN